MNVIPLCSLSTQNSPKRVVSYVNNKNKNSNNNNGNNVVNGSSANDSVFTQISQKSWNASFYKNQLHTLLDKAPNHFFASASSSSSTGDRNTVDDKIINGPITSDIKNDVVWGAEVVMHGGIDEHGRVLNDAWALQVLNQPLHTSQSAKTK